MHITQEHTVFTICLLTFGYKELMKQPTSCCDLLRIRGVRDLGVTSPELQSFFMVMPNIYVAVQDGTLFIGLK